MVTGRTRRHDTVEVDGQRVRELRERLRLSQGRVAELAGEVSRTYISKIEGAARSQVARAKAERLATALETTVEGLGPKAAVYGSPLAAQLPRDVLVRSLVQRVDDIDKHLQYATEDLAAVQELLQQLLLDSDSES